MNQKPKIQYVGQFYVHGSEARQLQLQEQKRQAKTKLPLARMQKIEKIYVDPVALAGIAVAVLLLVAWLTNEMELYAISFLLNQFLQLGLIVRIVQFCHGNFHQNKLLNHL